MKYLVLDIGGSAIKYALMTSELEFVEKGNEPTPHDCIESFIEVVGKIYDEYKNEIEGIAISMPGVLDSEKGYTYTGGSLTYNEGKEIVKILQERCPTKITIENDGKCAALAEVWKGSLKDCNDGVVIVLGTGVGGGIIKDRKLHKGKNFFAGEFSFIATDVNNIEGNGSWWGHLSGSKSLIEAAAKSKNMSAEELDGYKVFEYANNCDEDILKVLDDFTYKLAVQIFNLQCILDPEVFAIGGGISSQDILIEYIKKNVDKYHKNFISDVPKPNVIRCEFRNDANLIGALYNFINRN
ncbi:ROK family protein [Clostridium chromiireducens]|uniref:ROK family protein n=1 Tax=Clostridium chromiireducens TaxID=225345 RepID=A0A399IHL3_9CLOT|nr:ROK family protein [Clostridium chromiireducens]RII32455.1 ROK family protein [Clostridium chromiireducens]